jgi:hypothetical protein
MNYKLKRPYRLTIWSKLYFSYKIPNILRATEVHELSTQSTNIPRIIIVLVLSFFHLFQLDKC